MPHIQVYDYFGGVSTLDSADPEIIKSWLLEHCQRLATANTALGPVRVQVMPVWAPGEDGQLAPDWPGGEMRDYSITAEKLGPLADFLDDSRETKQAEELPFP